MVPSDETMMHFYQQMGRVFYGIANADNVVRKDEVEILKTLLRKDWLDLEDTHDSFGEDSAYQIEIVFDWLLENDWNKENILDDFKDFHNEHPSLFTSPVNMLISKTVGAIADSFHGVNKAEKAYLVKLGEILL